MFLFSCFFLKKDVLFPPPLCKKIGGFLPAFGTLKRSQPAFSRNRIFEIAFWTPFCWICRAHNKICAHFCTIRALASCWKAVGLKKKGPFQPNTLEGVLQVSVIWHILLNSLMSTWKCGYCFLVMETLKLSLLNGWKGCYCGTHSWNTLSREFKWRQYLPIAETLPNSLKRGMKCQK